MSQGDSDDKQALEILTKTIDENFIRGTEKTKSLFSFARIYRVPEDLRKLNESAYTPRLVAIGPLHSKDKHLQTHMEDVKMHYANHLFLRLTEGIANPKEKKDEVLRECVESMKKCKVKAKKYYTEEVTLVDKAKKYYGEELTLKNDDEMVQMMLVDGCFILELLYSYHKICQASCSTPQPINGRNGDQKIGGNGSKGNSAGGEKPTADPIIDNILTENIVKHDLMLLENQIPFFILEHLFELTVGKIARDQKTLVDYVRSYFHEFVIPKEKGKTESSGKCSESSDYYHILHLIHSSYIPGEQGEGNELRIKLKCTSHSELTLSASDLYYAGVKFVPTSDLFDVKFINEERFCWCRTLKFQVPTFSIHNTAELFLRNVIALEQCSPGVSPYFTSYAKVMDMLINSEEDVRVLVKKKIIHNYLSTDKDVSDIFNKLCKGVVLEDFHFDEECRKASVYNNHRQTRVVRYVKRLFIANPWAVLGFFLGFVTVANALYQLGNAIHGQYFRRHR